MAIDDLDVANSTDINNTVTSVSVFVIIRILAVLGNLLVIVNVAVWESLRKPQNVFSVNMAISDIQAGGFVHSAFQPIGHNKGQPIPGCDLYISYPSILLIASTLSVLFSSLDRLFTVKYPLRYPQFMTNRKAICAAVFIWIVSMIIGFSPLYGLSSGKGYSDVFSFCNGTAETSVSFYSFVVVGILLPAAVAVSSVYFYISRIAKKHDHNRRILVDGQINMSLSQTPKTTQLSRSARLFLAISMTMVIGWLPLAIVFLIPNAVKQWNDGLVFIITTVCPRLPHAVNPWIYTLRNTDFREATRKLLEGIFKKVRGCLKKTCPSCNRKVYPQNST